MTNNFDELLASQTPDALLITTPAGSIVYWNVGAQSIFGFTDKEAIGRTLIETIIPLERVEEEAQRFREVLESGQITYESIRCRKDGSLVNVDITRKTLSDAQGEVEFVLSSIKDVTDIKVLRDIARVEARFPNMLELAPDATIMTNLTGRIILANGLTEKLFGYERGELLGKPIETLLPERFRGAHTKHRSHYFSQPRTRSMGAGLDLYGLRKDGTEFPVEISLSPHNIDGGTLVMSAIRDISDRKRIERALSEKNIELQNATEAKNRFLANMSHELRTPLNAIIGFTGTLLMKLPGPLNADQEKQLSTIQGSARHLLSLINDLLDLAKIESGKVELHFEPVSCVDVIQELTATLMPMAERKGLQMRVELPPSEIPILTDRRALSQILINLANNAIKFTDIGEVAIVLTQTAEGANSITRIRIEDTGCGLKAEDQTHLFQAFTQIDSSSTRKFEGTGLGLHLSQKLAELLKGKISFKSEFARGSSFILEISSKA